MPKRCDWRPVALTNYSATLTPRGSKPWLPRPSVYFPAFHPVLEVHSEVTCDASVSDEPTIGPSSGPSPHPGLATPLLEN